METMEGQAGGMGRRPHSTAHRIITRKALPSSYDQFSAFLDACEVRPGMRGPWGRMWDRVFGRSSALQPNPAPDHPCRIPDHEVHLASSVYPGTAPSNWYVTKPR